MDKKTLVRRDDPETAGKVLGLRRWMSKIARSQISHQEIEEELEWLIFEYQSHLKFHRLKTNLGTLESLITIAGEVLENLLTIQWGKATRALFSLKRRQLASAEIKLTAPGKEIAYVIDTRDQFKK